MECLNSSKCITGKARRMDQHDWLLQLRRYINKCLLHKRPILAARFVTASWNKFDFVCLRRIRMRSKTEAASRRLVDEVEQLRKIVSGRYKEV